MKRIILVFHNLREDGTSVRWESPPAVFPWWSFLHIVRVVNVEQARQSDALDALERLVIDHGLQLGV